MPAPTSKFTVNQFDLSDIFVGANTTDLDPYKQYLSSSYVESIFGKSLWAWGSNTDGQFGLGDIVHRSSPVQVGSQSIWKQVSVGTDHVMAIRTDGTLWGWGTNELGELGLGYLITYRTSPTLISGSSNWKHVVAGESNTFAINGDGTLWSWGRNPEGQLGLGDRVHRSSPCQVGSLTNWESLSESFGFILAIKTDGTLWGWGYNGNNGPLGLNDKINRSSPTQVGTLTNWAQVSAGGDAGLNSTLAIKTDGTLWAWGNNGDGQLGMNDRVHRSSPVQVGTLTNWAQVAYGAYQAAAIKTDGTLWTWGSNFNGQLGIGTSGAGSYKSSPVQVGALTNWVRVVSTNRGEAMMALKSDGTIWAWGSNTDGQLGLGDRVHRSSPCQVGSLTDWTYISSDSWTSMGIRG